MDPLTMSLLAGAGTAIGALPDIIPSKYERDQRKRLREMQRKQEMGALGLTEQQRAAIEGQMRGARQQAQQYAEAERARLTQPTAQPQMALLGQQMQDESRQRLEADLASQILGMDLTRQAQQEQEIKDLEAERARLTQPTAQPQMALLGQQMQDESRQRLEADLASQILGMDLTRQAQQEQEIKDLEAAQAQYRRARAEGLTAPFQAGAEAAVGQMGLSRLLGEEPQSMDLAFLQREGRPIDRLTAQRDLRQRARLAGFSTMPTVNDILSLPPQQQYDYMYSELGMDDEEIAQYFANIGQRKILKNLNIPGDALDGTRYGIYGGERGY